MRTRYVVLALTVLLVAPAAAISQSAAPAYHVARTIRLGGEGGWDDLVADPIGHRLYISRSSHVMVIDTKRDSVIGDIANTSGVHSIAIARGLNRGFTSNGRDSSVTVFDLTTLAPITVIHGTGRNPDAIVYDSASNRVLAFNGGSASATVIDATNATIVGTIDLGGKPEFARADPGGRVFVNLEDKNEIVELDARDLKVLARWPLAPCEGPTGLASDPPHSRLFSVCGNGVMAIVDTKSGRVVQTVPTGTGTDGAGFDPATGLAFSSNGGGNLTIVHEDSPDTFSVVGNLPTQRGARTMTIDPATGRIYLVTAEFGPLPAPTPDRPRPRPPVIPGSFTLLVLEK